MIFFIYLGACFYIVGITLILFYAGISVSSVVKSLLWPLILLVFMLGAVVTGNAEDDEGNTI